jgi:hypothetical protein
LGPAREEPNLSIRVGGLVTGFLNGVPRKKTEAQRANKAMVVFTGTSGLLMGFGAGDVAPV